MDVMCARRQVSNREMAIVVLLPSKPMDGIFDVYNFNAILPKYFNVLTPGVPNTKFIFLDMDKFDLAPVTPCQQRLRHRNSCDLGAADCL